jgi:steroid delta-isomerase-like uncharacterized protein
MSEENKQLIRRWFEEVWNQRRTESIDAMFAEDGLGHGLEGEPLRGPAGFKVLHERFCTAFPDINIVVEDVVAEGDKVAARCTVRGSHGGDSLGFAATNSPVQFTGMVLARIENGKIVEAWNNFDFMGMYQQVGAI